MKICKICYFEINQYFFDYKTSLNITVGDQTINHQPNEGYFIEIISVVIKNDNFILKLVSKKLESF